MKLIFRIHFQTGAYTIVDVSDMIVILTFGAIGFAIYIYFLKNFFDFIGRLIKKFFIDIRAKVRFRRMNK